MLVRAAATDELDEIVALEASRDTVRWICETGADWHARAMADPDQEHLAAVAGGVLVGFAVLAGLTDLTRIVEIRRIVIGADHRGAGAGRELLRAALAHAYDARGATRVWLDVKPNNLRARTLYRSEGFVEDRTLVGAVVEPDGSRSDLVVMVHSGAPGAATPSDGRRA